MRNETFYPAQLSSSLRARWNHSDPNCAPLPPVEKVTELLDAMYQASLLREEGDQVQCRVILADPEVFQRELSDGGSKLHVLQFAEDCECTPHHLRKLAAAAGYYRTLLAVRFDAASGLRIWGMAVTGTDWINRVDGMILTVPTLPNHLVVQCLGPGHLVIAVGETRVLESLGGRLLTEGFDPFRSKWLPERFTSLRLSLIAESGQAELSGQQTTRLCDSFVKDVAQSVIRRTLRLVRGRGHGGMLVYVSDQDHSTVLLDKWFRFRVRFVDDDSTFRFRRLMIRLMKRAREVGEAAGLKTVTYNDFATMQDTELRSLEGALIEYGHFLADLMSVDGSLVLDRGFRLIGFGGEIFGDSHVTTIHRAHDIEATGCTAERADSSGTRHRSAYRLVQGMKDAIAVVVSQDGNVRFVAHHGDRLVYWPYLP